jgi:hypothetical protein
MDALYERSLAPLPKAESKQAWVRRPYERYHFPLALGILLLIAEIFFPERKSAVRQGAKNAQSLAGSNISAPTVTTIAVALSLLLPLASFASPSSALRDYKAGKFPEAQKEFERLAAADKTGDARFVFDAGDAAYRATNYDDALKYFNAALVSKDVKMQQKAYFNIGNVQYRQGEALLGKETVDLDAVKGQWEQAAKSFQNAVTLDKNDADAAHNLEFAKKCVVMIEQLKELALRAKLAADSSVRQRQYHQALEIMQQAVQSNIAAKQFQDYVKRLKEIDEIATPNQPAQH